VSDDFSIFLNFFWESFSEDRCGLGDSLNSFLLLFVDSFFLVSSLDFVVSSSALDEVIFLVIGDIECCVGVGHCDD